jgi:hypothetical protein
VLLGIFVRVPFTLIRYEVPSGRLFYINVSAGLYVFRLVNFLAGREGESEDSIARTLLRLSLFWTSSHRGGKIRGVAILVKYSLLLLPLKSLEVFVTGSLAQWNGMEDWMDLHIIISTRLPLIPGMKERLYRPRIRMLLEIDKINIREGYLDCKFLMARSFLDFPSGILRIQVQ